MAKPKKFKSFELLNQKYTVHYLKKITPAEDILGLCNSLKSVMYVATHYENKKLPEDQIHGTKWHEVVHAIFDGLGYHELSANEQLVDGVGKCLSQIEKTMH